MKSTNRPTARTGGRLLAAGAMGMAIALGGVASGDITAFAFDPSAENFLPYDAAQPYAPIGIPNQAGNGIKLSWATGGNQYRNYHFRTRQNITQFRASFTYQASAAAGYNDYGRGLSFVLCNRETSSNGTLTLGNYRTYGYAHGGVSASENAFQPSVALCLRLPPYNNLAGSGAGVYANASIGGSLPGIGTVNLAANRPINVTVRYNQVGDIPNFVYFTITDPATPGATYASDPLFFNIPAILGGPTAFVGFTTSVESSQQTITNFRFTPTCTADIDQNGTVSLQDLFTFLSRYFAGDLGADFDGSGDISVGDIFGYLTQYFAGCA